MVAKPPIMWVPGSPANAWPDRRGYLFEGFVPHTAVGTQAGVGSWFKDPNAQAGTHFSAGRGGEIHQHFSLQLAPFGHGQIEPGYTAAIVRENGDANPNWYLAGCEFDDLGKPGTADGLPTPIQFENGAWLAAWFFETEVLPHADRTGADISRRTIVRHGEISPRSKPFCNSWPEALMVRFVGRVRELVYGEPPAVNDWRVLYEQELRGELAGAQDDAMRAAVRIETVIRKLSQLAAM